MNALIITVIMVGGLVFGVMALDSCKPLWKRIEKQEWWKEIIHER